MPDYPTLLMRCLLFVPGNNQRFMVKAATLNADGVIFDLEDSVPATEKVAARELVARALGSQEFSPFTLLVRANHPGTPDFLEDAGAAVKPGLWALMVPSVQDAADMKTADIVVSRREREAGLAAGSVKLVALVETARGVCHAAQIAEASERVVALAFGAEDFCLDMGVQRTRDGAELLHVRAELALRARAADKFALDTVFSDVQDLEGLAAEASSARQLGYAGKLAIHPGQIPVILAAFSPGARELEEARKIVAAYERAQGAGLGAVAVEGRMVDAPVAERARRLLRLVAGAPGGAGAQAAPG